MELEFHAPLVAHKLLVNLMDFVLLIMKGR